MRMRMVRKLIKTGKVKEESKKSRKKKKLKESEIK